MDEHRGSQPTGPAFVPSDPRIAELDQHIRTRDPVGQGLFQHIQDPLRSIQLHQQQLGNPGVLCLGMIIHALPHVHWYKVQVGGGQSWVGACALTQGSVTPLGVHDTSSFPPNTLVALWQPEGINYAIILGAIPHQLRQGGVSCPDWLTQGGGSGLKREEAHRYPIREMQARGGVIDFSSSRPLDATCMERGFIADTGVQLYVSAGEAVVKVNEQCGLYLSFFDSHARLAGVHLVEESIVHEKESGDDEGEAHQFSGQALYTWEALGLYATGTAFTAVTDDVEVQYRSPKGKVDVAVPDLQPIYRWQEYGGYLGQGYVRMLVAPARQSGVRRYQDSDNDEGLFCEAVGADGALSLRSAKSVYIGKRGGIVAPRRIKPIADAGGDDRQAGNYTFAGQFGNQPHKVGDLAITGNAQSVQRVAGVLDIIAHLVNWKVLHPFHYHKKDFRTPQESESQLGAVQEVLDYSILANSALLPDAIPQKLHIDHRYGDVNYYQREAYFVMHEDGAISLGCGAGSELIFMGGDVVVACPGTFRVQAGKRCLIYGGEFVVSASGSVDITSDKDVRLKSEYNMQVLGGNSGSGGVLIESFGGGIEQKYENAIGEDVVSSGIVLRANDSTASVLGRYLYLRSIDGSVTIDAARGLGSVSLVSQRTDIFTTAGVSLWHGPSEDNEHVGQSHYFGPQATLIGSSMTVNGYIIGCGSSGLIMDGNIFALGSIQCSGSVADGQGGQIGKISDKSTDKIREVVEGAADSGDGHVKAGETAYKEEIVGVFYEETQIGNEDTLNALHFSFRDDDNGVQYGALSLLFPEARWQRLARIGAAVGGVVWTPSPVTYQGRDLYPWPGAAKLLDEDVFFQMDTGLVDPQTGGAVDRPEPYEEASLKEGKTVKLSEHFTVIR